MSSYYCLEVLKPCLLSIYYLLLITNKQFQLKLAGFIYAQISTIFPFLFLVVILFFLHFLLCTLKKLLFLTYHLKSYIIELTSVFKGQVCLSSIKYLIPPPPLSTFVGSHLTHHSFSRYLLTCQQHFVAVCFQTCPFFFPPDFVANGNLPARFLSCTYILH